MRSAAGRAQSAFEDRMTSARARAAGTIENLEKMFQARVQKALHQMGVPGSRDIARLSARVEELNANIEKLARRRAPARSGDGRRAAAETSSAAH
jgi:poly(hydroxyalkanoate) granule-associated protein